MMAFGAGLRVRVRPWLQGRLLVLIAGGAALLLAGALALALSRGIGGPELGASDTGFEIAADFALPTFDGGSFTLSEHSDGPAFIYFWASWCLPCRLEAPVIQRLWPEFETAGYTFVGVNILDSESDARAFVEEFDLTFPMVSDDSGGVYLEYGVYGLPEAFFLRPGMVVSEKFIGELNEQELRAMLGRAGG
jgi:cytochrome c biogenesis protein CcmG/thiol:disulfide interchange protein DsbE